MRVEGKESPGTYEVVTEEIEVIEVIEVKVGRKMRERRRRQRVTSTHSHKTRRLARP